MILTVKSFVDWLQGIEVIGFNKRGFRTVLVPLSIDKPCGCEVGSLKRGKRIRVYTDGDVVCPLCTKKIGKKISLLT